MALITKSSPRTTCMPAFSFNLSDFVMIWWGLLYEALPFVVLGTVVSGAVERCVSRETVVRFFPKSRVLGIGASACLGLIFPICECGVVPVVRRLIRKGVPVSCGVTYLLAAPIINPLVILSTLVAFRDKDSWSMAWTVTGLRVGMGFVVAVLVGLAVWRLFGRGDEQQILLPRHRIGDDGDARDEIVSKGSVIGDTLRLAATDFIEIGATLVAGTAIAALVNSGFSRAAMEPFARSPLAAVTSMSVLAVGLNLCSEADAFVARSFYAFPLAAKMAFLVLGPMVDIKLLAMYTTIFRAKAILAISGLATLLIFALSITGHLWMPWFIG